MMNFNLQFFGGRGSAGGNSRASATARATASGRGRSGRATGGALPRTRELNSMTGTERVRALKGAAVGTQVRYEGRNGNVVVVEKISADRWQNTGSSRAKVRSTKELFSTEKNRIRGVRGSR